MAFGPVQWGVFWFLIVTSITLGVSERWGNAAHSPDAIGLGSALFSSGFVALIALLGFKPF